MNPDPAVRTPVDVLINPIKDYPWGSRTAIAGLTGRVATGPEAEMWLGAHPSGPSRLARDGVELTLAEAVAADPCGMLGQSVLERFGQRLPYLMKLIAVDRPLSLQVHPDERQAADGHARGDRNYADPWHKPEMIIALTPFSGLAGFRPAEQAAMLVARLNLAALEPVVAALSSADIPGALRLLLEWPSSRRELVESIVWASSCVHHPDYALVGRLARQYPEDPAVLAPLLLRRHVLAPGQALFLGAGVLHCYLDGFGVELMACSDNVVRAGLTSKPVDVPELLRIIRVDAQPHPVPLVDGVYLPPVPEFLLRRICLGEQPAPQRVMLTQPGPRIVLCTEGTVQVGEEIGLRPGESAFIGAAEGPVAVTGHGTAFCAEPQR